MNESFYTKKLAKKDVEEMRNYLMGARFAYENATNLLSEAEILLNANKFSRSKVLATFALEEIGKAFSIMDVFANLETACQHTLNDLKKEVYNAFTGKAAHELKIRKVYNFVYRYHPELLPAVPKFAKLEHKAKLDSLYVGMKNGKFYLPEAQSQKEANDYLNFVSDLSAFSCSVLKGFEQIYSKYLYGKGFDLAKNE